MRESLIFKWFKMSKEEEELLKAIKSCKTLKVRGRGALSIDPAEVANSQKYIDMIDEFTTIVSK